MQNNISNSFRELTPGTTLGSGKYTIERIIGAGGFGITYYARQNGLNRVVAIKEFFINGCCIRNTQAHTVLLQGINEEVYEKYKRKFIEEAQTLAALKHANIVQVIDVFDENNTSYMVMPFVEGQTLQHLVDTRGTLDYELVVNYLSQIAGAVGYVHSKNILHRDIKPGNIIITPDYHAILIDFGSAREFVQDKTQQHTSMVTQGYAPMEQYDNVSRKGSYTDIYALGAVFYFALTGQKPLEATTRTLEKMLDPIALNPKISKDVNRTILKAMAMKPADRHQSVSEFMDDLLGVRPSAPLVEKVSKVNNTKNSNKWLWVWILLPILVIGGVVTGVIVNNSIKENNRIIAEKNEIIAQTKVVTDSIAMNIVFWSENDQKYHLFKNCSHLSGKIMEGTVEQAFGHNKKLLCSKCLNQIAEYKKYQKEAMGYYDAADYYNTKDNLSKALDYYNKALDYCNKALTMRSDNQRMITLKQDIEKSIELN
jgi:serine/threonine protein kinase